MRVSHTGSLVLFATALTAASASAQARAKVNRYGNPEKLAPSPTTAPITEQDLQTRLYQFADDSMLGRQVGRIGNFKGTNYIAAELKRLGVVPAGDNGSYFQTLPYHFHQFTNHSRLTADGNPLEWETDWVAIPGARAPRPIVNVPVIFGGVDGDTTQQIAADRAAGKFVVLVAGAARGGGGPGGRGAAPRGGRRGGSGRSWRIRAGAVAFRRRGRGRDGRPRLIERRSARAASPRRPSRR